MTTTSMREQLLGYLLGALEADEHLAVEQALADNPRLCEEMALLQRRLEPLERTERDYAPPIGLVQRTCDFVLLQDRGRLNPPSPPSASRSGDGEREVPSANAQIGQIGQSGPADAPRPAFTEPLNARPQRWSFADATVLVGLSVVLIAMVVPAILSSRAVARREVCENNLREVGGSLMTYANYSPDQRFPAIPLTGNRAFAGVVAPTLSDCEMLPRCEALVCPSDSIVIRRITMSEIDEAGPLLLQQLQKVALGSFGYNLGVVVDNQYQAPRNQSRAMFVLMSETPAVTSDSAHRGKHGGNGFNMLFEDHHIAYVVDGRVPRSDDDPFTNLRGLVEAGIGPDDCVIGSSHVPPLREVTLKQQSR